MITQITNLAWVTVDQFMNGSNASMSGLLVYLQLELPFFVPLLLFCLWLVALLATYFGSIALEGRGDFLSSFAVANIFIAVITVVAANISFNGIPFIPFTIIIPVVALAIMGVAILFLQNTEG